MGLLDKIWDDVFAGPQPSVGPTSDRHLEPLQKQRSGPVDFPASPRSALERADSSNSPAPSPGSSTGRRVSEDFVGGSRGSTSQKIAINRPPRLSLDHSQSLPSGFSSGHYMPDIVSPKNRKEENVWRGVFHPGSNKAGMDKIGAARFDKADPKGPSVYDWYNPLTT